MPHILIVSATFYQDLADALLKGIENINAAEEEL